MAERQPAPGLGRVERPLGLVDVGPEAHDLAVVVVRPGWQLGARRDDGRARGGEMARDRDLARERGVAVAHRRGDGHDPRDDRRRSQVHEQVAGVAQHDGLVAAHAVARRDGEGRAQRGLAHRAAAGAGLTAARSAAPGRTRRSTRRRRRAAARCPAGRG